MIRLSQIAWTPALRVAAACAALALVADVALLARAFSSRADAPVVPLRLAVAPPITPRATAAETLIDSAAALQPFDPLAGPQTLADASVIIPQAMPTPVAQPRLVGTVVDGARSFVVMALADGSIKVVRIGERGGDLRLRGVTAGGATFDDINGGRVTLRSPTPGAEPQP
jgi:hypothetical protein